MKSKLNCAALLFLIVTTSVRAEVFKGRSAPVQIEASDGWSLSELSKDDDASLQLMLTDKSGDNGVMVLYEPGTSLDLSLDDYGKTVVDQMSGRLTEASHTKWNAVKLNEHQGLQCELTGVRSNVKLAYLVTVLKAEDSYNQVLAFSKQSKFPDEKAELVGITNSFKVSPMPPPSKDAPDIVIKGKDGTTEMHLPASWSSDGGGSQDAQLLASERSTGCFVEVITENRKDLTFTLKGYADKVAENMLGRGSGGSRTDWQSVKINEKNALQCDENLTVENVKVTYVLTVIETPDNFHQVLAWSLASSFKNNRPELANLASRLKEVKKD